MLEGVFSAIITPFDRDRNVDEDAYRALIDRQIAGGVDGFVPCGTTGESATLNHDEHKQVIDLCLEHVAGRAKVIAGTGSNSTRESIELTQYAEKAGADAALLITPYYNKPTQAGLYDHYKTVAEAVELPLVLYNVPGRTAVDMSTDTVCQLAEISNIVALKDATSSMERASEVHVRCGDSLTLISGDDASFYPFLVVGGRGCISVTANVAPERVVRLWKAWNERDLETALKEHEKLLEINQLLFCETSPIPVKALAHMMGMCQEYLRRPLVPLADAFREPLRQAAQRLDIL
ncbi:MAG: 4-hydroxy-tetrahydrodipicolinate synthase [Magnetococcales bacterium]|nr:4-hydroxy-tetrahydrodipicolinate synthase [Magnetococcales bacterium]